VILHQALMVDLEVCVDEVEELSRPTLKGDWAVAH